MRNPTKCPRPHDARAPEALDWVQPLGGSMDGGPLSVPLRGPAVPALQPPNYPILDPLSQRDSVLP